MFPYLIHLGYLRSLYNTYSTNFETLCLFFCIGIKLSTPLRILLFSNAIFLSWHPFSKASFLEGKTIVLRIFLEDTRPFMDPLIPLFWTSGDVFSGFKSKSGWAALWFQELMTMCRSRAEEEITIVIKIDYRRQHYNWKPSKGLE